jgi:putative restriction endonuclease
MPKPRAPSPPQTIAEYLRAFERLNVNRAGGVASPHKPCMLLAMLGLAEAGKLVQNQIRFEPPLLERYARFFNIVRGPNDHPNPWFPFFHLRSDGFWRLQAKPGREAALEVLDSARSASVIEENIAWASLDSALHSLVLEATARLQLQQQLVVAWFGAFSQPMNAVFEEERQIDNAEIDLRQRVEGRQPSRIEDSSDPARSAAFRRIVTEAYDYRCAASGWRIILPDSTALVEAAHLVPYADSHDDDPRNGIALSPTFHWAMDRYIIAPGPDLKWHVSKTLDDRLPDNRPLLELEDKRLILPREKAYSPKEESLQWRLSKLAR